MKLEQEMSKYLGNRSKQCNMDIPMLFMFIKKKIYIYIYIDINLSHKEGICIVFIKMESDNIYYYSAI